MIEIVAAAVVAVVVLSAVAEPVADAAAAAVVAAYFAAYFESVHAAAVLGAAAAGCCVTIGRLYFNFFQILRPYSDDLPCRDQNQVISISLFL